MVDPKMARVRPALPPSVVVTKIGIRDEVLGQEYPTNPAALYILRRFDGQTDLSAVASALTAETGAPYAEVFDGVLHLVTQLNRNFLLNLMRASTVVYEAWAVLAICLRFLGWPIAIHQVTYRTSIRTLTVRCLPDVCTMVWKALRTPLLLTAIFLGAPAVVMGYGLAFFGLGLLFFTAVVMHEMGHIWALRRCGLKSENLFLAASVGHIFIGRERTNEDVETFVGLAGPSLSAAIGVVLACGSWLTQYTELLIASIPFLMQLLTLLPVFDDNKLLRGLVVQSASRWKGGGWHMSLRSLWSVVANILAYYVALIVLSFLVSIAADIAGFDSFRLAIGPIEFYRFTKEADGFRGTLGGGGLWLAILLAGLSFLILHVQRRSRASHS